MMVIYKYFIWRDYKLLFDITFNNSVPISVIQTQVN
jgi:hypothetical protein